MDDEETLGIILPHLRTVLKAVLITVMIVFSIAQFGGSYGRTAIVSVIVLAASSFLTWRRYLEPLSLAVFVIAVAATCAPDAVSRLCR